MHTAFAELRHALNRLKLFHETQTTPPWLEQAHTTTVKEPAPQRPLAFSLQVSNLDRRGKPRPIYENITNV